MLILLHPLDDFLGLDMELFELLHLPKDWFPNKIESLQLALKCSSPNNSRNCWWHIVQLNSLLLVIVPKETCNWWACAFKILFDILKCDKEVIKNGFPLSFQFIGNIPSWEQTTPFLHLHCYLRDREILLEKILFKKFDNFLIDLLSHVFRNLTFHKFPTIRLKFWDLKRIKCWEWLKDLRNINIKAFVKPSDSL